MIEIQITQSVEGCKTDESPTSKKYKTVSKAESYREALIQLAELSNSGALTGQWIRIKEGSTITIINSKPNYANHKS